MWYMNVTKKTFLSFRGHLSTSLFTFKTSGKPLMDFITIMIYIIAIFFLNTVCQAFCQFLGFDFCCDGFFVFGGFFFFALPHLVTTDNSRRENRL